MKEGLNEEVQRHVLSAYVRPAKVRGENRIRIKAGDVHRDLHWVNRVPSVCTTLGSKKFQRETGLELIEREGPPSGMGTRAVFTYRLSAEKRSVPPGQKRVSWSRSTERRRMSIANSEEEKSSFAANANNSTS